MRNSIPQLLEATVAKASEYIGTVEVGGDNSGPLVEMFQKAVDGKAQKESWCMSFVQHVIKSVSEPYSYLHPTEHCMTAWNKTPAGCRIKSPVPGCIVIWQYYDKLGKPTAAGHCGIVTKVHSDGFESIEGNTGAGQEVVREGDGVYRKRRFFAGTKKMKIVGYLNPWIATSKP